MNSAQLKRLSEQLKNSLSSLELKLAAETLPTFLEKILQLPMYPHMREWCTLVQTERKLLIEAARDHFKSSFFSYGYPLWLVQQIKNPENAFGVALFSYAQPQAEENLRRIRRAIEETQYLQWLMPVSHSGVWDACNLDMSNGCWIKAYGFGSAYRGRHPKLTVVDDPCKDTGALSIEQQIQFFAGVIVPAAKHGSQIIVTGNPVDKLDFLEWLEKNKAFRARYYPVLDSRGRPLAPEHYSVEAIEDKRAMIPAHIFAREYLLKRVGAADAKFREEWLRFYEDSDIAGQPLYKILTIDPAISPGGDDLGCVVTGTDSKLRTYVLDHMGFNGPFRDGISALCDMIEKNLPLDFVGIETFAFQKMYQIWLEEEIRARGIPVVVEEVGRDTRKTKTMRIESLQPKLQQGRLFFKRDQRPLLDQFLLWDPLSKTNDDDEIDALSWQVPLWRTPLDDDEAIPSSRPKFGTFAEALEQSATVGDGYIGRLFSDMVH